MDINSLKGREFIGVIADNTNTIIDYFLKEGGVYTGTFEDNPVGYTYFVNNEGYVCALPNAIFKKQYPLATIICLNSDQRSLLVSLEEARRWYFESGTIMKDLALRVYSEEELLPSIKAMMGDEAYPINSPKNKALRELEICAKYFNKGWTKSCGSTGYFIGMGVRGDKILGMDHIGIGQHDSVVYPGLIYFKYKKDAHFAAKVLGAEKILALFS